MSASTTSLPDSREIKQATVKTNNDELKLKVNFIRCFYDKLSIIFPSRLCTFQKHIYVALCQLDFCKNNTITINL